MADLPVPQVGFVPLTGGAGPPLAFMGIGLAFLFAAGAWGAARVAQDIPFHLHPQVVALAHLWLPGFLLSVCAGACQQLMPVVLGRRLHGPAWLPWVHVSVHALGCVLLVSGLARAAYGFAALGGMLVAAGAVLLAYTTLGTFRASSRRDAVAWSFPLAAGWLCATVLAGLVLAFNRRAPFLPLPIQALLGAHAHLGLAGFFLALLQGVSFQLVPMFTLGRAAALPLATTGLVLAQVGLLILTPGLAFGNTAASTLGATCIACGVLCSFLAGARTLATRRRRKLETGIAAFSIGACLLAAAAIAGAGLLAWRPSGEVSPGVLLAYGTLVIVGALPLCVLGMLCKILPFLVWMRAYAPFAGKRAVPAATELARKPLEQGWLACHTAGSVLLVTGAASASPRLAAVGGVLVALGVLSYGVSSVAVLLHLVQSLQPPSSTTQPVPKFS